MADIKHVGRMKATKRKVLIAYRTLPGESDSALVIQTENLSDDQHDSLMTLVESPASQSAYEFAEVLARSRFRDGSVMLANLHATGRLFKVKTSEVEVTPNTQTSLSLDQLNQIIAEQRGVSVNDLALGNNVEQDIVKVKDISPDPQEPVVAESQVAKIEEPVTTVPEFASPEEEAKYYRSTADKLSKQAAEFRRKAEELVPSKKKTDSAPVAPAAKKKASTKA